MIAQRDKTTPELDGVATAPSKPPSLRRKSIFVATTLIVFVLTFSLYVWVALTLLPPRTYLDVASVGLTTRSQALERFYAQTAPLPTMVELHPNTPQATSTATLTADALGLHQNPEQALDTFYGGSDSPLSRVLTFSRRLFVKNIIAVPILFEDDVVKTTIAELAAATDQPSREPSIILKTSGNRDSLSVDEGVLGVTLDATASAQQVVQALQQKQAIIALPTQQSGRVLTEAETSAVQDRAAALVGKQLLATAERLQLSLNDQKLISLIDPPNQWNDDGLTTLVTEWQQQTGTQPQDPVFTYDPATLKVTAFTPPRNGRTIQIEQTKAQLLEGMEVLLQQPETKTVTKELALVETPPTTSLASLNTLGIQERIGFGESKYAHSIPNRIHNVAITAQRINNVIIPPGSEFSFNKTLGDVSAATGFRSAYVIKNGKTELGDGGGVCQVSTTLFRAVLDAGLAVTKRLAHSYRVSYYELDRKPGADATVYAGDVDFRFKNDTPNHILVHAVTDDKNTYMYVELYGTSDGRYTKIVEHKTWDPRPALPPEYFPDPTLPPGKVVQIDWAASGIRASLTNVIYDKNNTEIRRDTYVSNYRPWSAKYLQGVAP